MKHKHAKILFVTLLTIAIIICLFILIGTIFFIINRFMY